MNEADLIGGCWLEIADTFFFFTRGNECLREGCQWKERYFSEHTAADNLREHTSKHSSLYVNLD